MYIVSTVCTCICTFMEIDFDTYDNLEFPFYVRSLYSCRAVALCGAWCFFVLLYLNFYFLLDTKKVNRLHLKYTAQHKVMGQSNEDDRITNMLKKSIKSSASSISIEATNEKKVVSEKYVAEKVEMKEK